MEYLQYQDAGRTGSWQTYAGRLAPLPPPPPGQQPPPPPPGGTGGGGSLPALALHGGAIGSPPTSADITSYTTTLARPWGVYHYFAQQKIWTSYAASPFAGMAGQRAILLDWETAKDGSQAAAMDTFLASCQDAGLDMRITLYHNPAPKFTSSGGVTGYLRALEAYVPAIKRRGMQFIYDLGAYQAYHVGNLPVYWPGDHVAVDQIGLEYYQFDFIPPDNGRLDSSASFADTKKVPFGLTEYGANYAGAGASTDPVCSAADGLTFLEYVRDFFAARIAAGKPQADMLTWSARLSASGATPGYVLANQPSSWLPVYQAISDQTTAAKALYPV